MGSLFEEKNEIKNFKKDRKILKTFIIRGFLRMKVKTLTDMAKK
jgi:hypothetical protein